MKKTAIILMIITIFSKIIGFTRDITLSYFYGVSNVSDAYLISQNIPMAIFAFIGVGISTGYIPMYSKIENQFGVNESNKYTNNLINIMFVICTVIVILSLIFTGQIVKAFASGFAGETLSLAVKFTRISIISIYFSGIVYIFSGYLQIKGNYIIPALIGFPMNFFIILSIYLSMNADILLLAIGSVIAVASQFMFLIPFIHRTGYKYNFNFDIKDKHIINMAAIALPVMIGVSTNQVNTLIDRTIASQITVGGISALNYASKLNNFIQGIFVLSIATVMYPLISKMAAADNIEGLKKSISEAITGINLLVIPATIGAMIFAEPIVKLLFGRGAFNEDAISMTAYALYFYSIGMVGYGLREVLSRAFYSIQDTRTPMINSIIAIFINVILNIILSRFLGIGGLALATSISAIFCTILLIYSLRKKIGQFGIWLIITSFFKMLIASIAMGILAKVINKYLITMVSVNISLVISIGIGAIFYFTTISFMRIEEVDNIISGLRRKLSRINID